MKRDYMKKWNKIGLALILGVTVTSTTIPFLVSCNNDTQEQAQPQTPAQPDKTEESQPKPEFKYNFNDQWEDGNVNISYEYQTNDEAVAKLVPLSAVQKAYNVEIAKVQSSNTDIPNWTSKFKMDLSYTLKGSSLVVDYVFSNADGTGFEKSKVEVVLTPNNDGTYHAIIASENEGEPAKKEDLHWTKSELQDFVNNLNKCSACWSWQNR